MGGILNDRATEADFDKARAAYASMRVAAGLADERDFAPFQTRRDIRRALMASASRDTLAMRTPADVVFAFMAAQNASTAVFR